MTENSYHHDSGKSLRQALNARGLTGTTTLPHDLLMSLFRTGMHNGGIARWIPLVMIAICLLFAPFVWAWEGVRCVAAGSMSPKQLQPYDGAVAAPDSLAAMDFVGALENGQISPWRSPHLWLAAHAVRQMQRRSFR